MIEPKRSEYGKHCYAETCEDCYECNCHCDRNCSDCDCEGDC